MIIIISTIVIVLFNTKEETYIKEVLNYYEESKYLLDCIPPNEVVGIKLYSFALNIISSKICELYKLEEVEYVRESDNKKWHFYDIIAQKKVGE